MTADSAAYIYTGVQAQYRYGRLILLQVLHQDYISKGDGKDLGHILEFKSEVQISVDFVRTVNLVFLTIIYLMLA